MSRSTDSKATDATIKTVPLVKLVRAREDARRHMERADEQAAVVRRLDILLDRLLLLPEPRRHALNLSPEFRPALTRALQSDYDFGVFIERFTGAD